ncbi:MAG: hypothetical protein WC943_03950 [Elusimicrobiota bacterium]|jgi:hypothetical protein
MRLVLSVFMLATSLFSQVPTPSPQPSLDDSRPHGWWLPHPAVDRKEKEEGIMKLIKAGVPAYDRYERLRAEERRKRERAIASKNAGDEQSWLEDHKKLIEARKDIKKLDQAIQETNSAYGIRAMSDEAIKNGPMAGKNPGWKAEFCGDKRDIRTAADKDGNDRYIEVPEATEEDPAITKDDGFTAVRIQAFMVVLDEGNPSSLAGVLFREAVLYTRLVTQDDFFPRKGWKSKEREEFFAYEKKLEAAKILGLSRKQIEQAGQRRDKFKDQLWEIAKGKKTPTPHFMAPEEETDNRQYHVTLQGAAEQFKRETRTLQGRIEARGAVEELRRFGDYGCRNAQFYETDVSAFKSSVAKAGNLELGLDPSSALDGLEGCPRHVLHYLLAGDVPSPQKFAEVAAWGRHVASLDFDEAIARLQEVARKGCVKPTWISDDDAEGFAKALSLVHANSLYFGVEPYPGTSGLSGCPLTMLRRFLSAGVPYSAERLNAVSSEVVTRVRMDVVQDVARVACARPGKLTKEEAEVFFFYMDNLTTYSPGYFQLAVSELAGCPQAMLRALGAARYRTTLERCVWDFNAVANDISGPGGQTPDSGSGDGSGDRERVDLDGARRRIERARRELGGLR